LVEVVIEGESEHAHPLRPGPGYHSAVIPGVAAGARYRFRLDGAHAYPDPLSRFQPDGPHGPSLVVNPAAFPWSDEAWRGVALPGQVIYELHVGTFTPEGTFDAAIRELPALSELGVTLLEVMPVAEFPAASTGPTAWRCSPFSRLRRRRAFKRFVDAAHRRLGVILTSSTTTSALDGCYLREFSDDLPTATTTSGGRDQLRRRTPRRCAS
jgi:maltooligosyltrehalose trehalohydrolase